MEKVCYSVGGRSILQNFDLYLEMSVNRTILGVSGVGKTTILKLLLGLLKPDSGRITIGGGGSGDSVGERADEGKKANSHRLPGRRTVRFHDGRRKRGISPV